MLYSKIYKGVGLLFHFQAHFIYPISEAQSYAASINQSISSLFLSHNVKKKHTLNTVQTQTNTKRWVTRIQQSLFI